MGKKTAPRSGGVLHLDGVNPSCQSVEVEVTADHRSLIVPEMVGTRVPLVGHVDRGPPTHADLLPKQGVEATQHQKVASAHWNEHHHRQRPSVSLPAAAVSFPSCLFRLAASCNPSVPGFPAFADTKRCSSSSTRPSGPNSRQRRAVPQTGKSTHTYTHTGPPVQPNRLSPAPSHGLATNTKPEPESPRVAPPIALPPPPLAIACDHVVVGHAQDGAAAH